MRFCQILLWHKPVLRIAHVKEAPTKPRSILKIWPCKTTSNQPNKEPTNQPNNHSFWGQDTPSVQWESSSQRRQSWLAGATSRRVVASVRGSNLLRGDSRRLGNFWSKHDPSEGQMGYFTYLENSRCDVQFHQLETPKTRNSCLQKWYTRFSRYL